MQQNTGTSHTSQMPLAVSQIGVSPTLELLLIHSLVLWDPAVQVSGFRGAGAPSSTSGQLSVAGHGLEKTIGDRWTG